MFWNYLSNNLVKVYSICKHWFIKECLYLLVMYDVTETVYSEASSK
jgi:hypothetical protein